MSFLIAPSELYSVYLYDHDGNIVSSLRNWTYLEYHQRVNNAWNHQVTIQCSKDSDQVDLLRSIQDDWFLLIYRTDPITLIKSLVYEGFQMTVVDQTTSVGDLIFNLYGGGYTELLKRRIVVPPTAEKDLTFTGNGETVLKSFVNSCIVAPTDANRVFPGFSIEADTSSGSYIEHAARYVNLYTTCTTIADDTNLDFGVYGSEPPGSFYLRARPYWGLDRRIGNTAGNPVTIFDLRFGNMDIPILSLNSSEEKNYIYTGGQGAGEDRIIREVYDTVAIARSPWCRKEAFVDARQQENDISVEAQGNAYLWANRKQQNLTFDIRPTTNTRWIRDWNLGDLVTARYYDYEFDKHIIEVSVVVSGANTGLTETISAEIEDVQ